MCVDDQTTCRIEQNAFAYLPPAFVVEEGVPIVFASLDIGHTTVGGSGIGGGFGCFFVDSPPGIDSPPVVLDIAGGALTASTDGGAPEPCADAVAAPGGAFVLPFHCFVHPTMRGAIVVTPAA